MSVRKLVIESNFDGLDLAVDFIEDFCKKAECSEELLDKVLLLGSELVTNGIEHGNKLSPYKHVTIGLKSDETAIEIDVKDEGEGFDPEDIADPLAEENLLSPRGRGVFILEQLADSLEFKENGTRAIARCHR